jgi:hypothetical protein
MDVKKSFLNGEIEEVYTLNHRKKVSEGPEKIVLAKVGKKSENHDKH